MPHTLTPIPTQPFFVPHALIPVPAQLFFVPPNVVDAQDFFDMPLAAVLSPVDGSFGVVVHEVFDTLPPPVELYSTAYIEAAPAPVETPAVFDPALHFENLEYAEKTALDNDIIVLE